MATEPIDPESVRRLLAAEGIVLDEDRLAPMTEAVRAFRAMAAVLHDNLPASAEPAGLEIPRDDAAERA